MSTATPRPILIRASRQNTRHLLPYLHSLALGGQLEARDTGEWVLAAEDEAKAEEALGKLFDSGLVSCLSF
ncbi:hypothetical protein E8E95_16580 [Pseudomonas sp. BN414]|uniref:hypothetical protein n=1 Tax=Pseudomonas sp. BN414 TaxID=2567888 RepID=UPI0024558577|nr:hypothetical protein [Pseudomonas sp. BN414]MDH4568303.1 hypothetical protein [Pseudomonas sp. BN414]